jgi:hypothetical protein
MKLNFINRRLADARVASEELYGLGNSDLCPEYDEEGPQISDQPEASSPCYLYLDSENNEHCGPCSRRDLQRMILVGTVTENTMVWTVNMPRWAPIRELDQFTAPGPQLDNPEDSEGHEDRTNYKVNMLGVSNKTGEIPVGNEDENTNCLNMMHHHKQMSSIDFNPTKTAEDDTDNRIEELSPQQLTSELTPFSKAAWRRKQIQEKRAQAFEKKNALKVEIARARRLNIVKAKQQRIVAKKKDRNQRIASKRIQQQRSEAQKEWLVRVVVGLSAATLSSCLHARMLKVSASRTIQRFWAAVNPCKFRRLVLTLILKKHKRPLLLKVRKDRRRRAVSILKGFLNSQMRLTRVCMVFNKLRWRVVTLQRVWRDFLACRQARILGLMLLWKKLEANQNRMDLLQEAMGLGEGLGKDRQRLLDEEQKRMRTMQSIWGQAHFWKHKAVQSKVTVLMSNLERRDRSKLVTENKQLLKAQQERWMRQHIEHEDKPNCEATKLENNQKGNNQKSVIHSGDTASSGADSGSCDGSSKSHGNSNTSSNNGLSTSGSANALYAAAYGSGGCIKGLVGSSRRSRALLGLLHRMRRSHTAQVVELHRQEKLKWQALQDGGGHIQYTMEEARQVLRKSSDAGCILQLIQQKIAAASKVDSSSDDDDEEGVSGCDHDIFETPQKGRPKRTRKRRRRKHWHANKPSLTRHSFLLYSTLQKHLDVSIKSGSAQANTKGNCLKQPAPGDVANGHTGTGTTLAEDDLELSLLRSIKDCCIHFKSKRKLHG